MPGAGATSVRLRFARFAALVAFVSLAAVFAAAPPQAVAAEPAVFTNNAATASFPASLRFQVVVESAAEIQAVELYWRPAAGETLSLALPEFERGHRVEVEHEIDMTINYLPPGLDITWFWRVTDADGVVTESEPATLLYMDQRHNWRTLTDGLVTLYWYDGSEDFARDIVDTANRTIALLNDRFDVTADEGIRLVIYGNDRDFSEALPPNSAEWIGGQAYTDLHLIIAALAPGGGASAEIRRMVPHEVSHLIVYQATLNPFNSPPNWLDEGLAVYNQETPDSRFVPLLNDAVAEGRLIPVRALNSSFPFDPDEALLSYAESESIVRFIIERWGDQGIARLLGAFRQELSYDAVVQTALGLTIEQLDAEWKAWLGYPGDAPPGEPARPNDDDLTPSERRIVLGVLIGLTTCFTLAGIAAFVLAFRSRRARPPVA